MMFRLTSFTTFLFIFALIAHAKVVYQKGFFPDRPGKPRTGPANKHGFFVVGNKNAYKFGVQKNEAGKWSDAICGNVVHGSKGLGYQGKSFYTTPCEVNASKGDQVVAVQCIDPKHPKQNKSGHATITWYKGPSRDGQRSYGVHVETEGDIWVGTTLESSASAPLSKGPWSLGGLKNEAVILNCHNNKRTIKPE